MPFQPGNKIQPKTRLSKTHKRSRPKAIEFKCRDCICDDDAPGNWRQQVTACTITDCALWEWRPVTKGRPVSALKSS